MPTGRGEEVCTDEGRVVGTVPGAQEPHELGSVAQLPLQEDMEAQAGPDVPFFRRSCKSRFLSETICVEMLARNPFLTHS